MKKSLSHLIFALGLITAIWCAAVPVPAAATIARTLNLTKQDIADIVRIERHLNANKTVSARFLQVSSNGEYSEGMVHIQRPGRMRLEYDPPNPTMVIADGTNLIYIDRELDQTTAIFLSLTPAELILRDTLSFASKDLLVTGFERSAGVIQLLIVKTDDPLEGRIMLIFSDKPLELRKWVVVDSQGIKTTVSLLGPEFGKPLDPNLFDFEMPAFDKDLN